MNKKFLSAILFGALMVTSTGTFVSCKDYDEDIENLQGQINNLATKSDVEAKLSQLQGAIDAAKAEALAAAKAADNSEELAALEAEIAALEKCSCDVDAMLAKVQESVDADMATYKTELEALIKQAESLVGEIADFVTDVELNIKGIDEEYAMDFFTITEKANVFEDGLTGALTFEEGKQTQIAENSIIVRVSPTNAMLKPEMISLVNSKGENLDEYLDIKVEKYDELLSRAATNNGLWKVTPVLKKYDKDQFAALKYVDVEDESKGQILYAIQVNNALASAEARYATSAYSITMGDWDPFKGNGELLFTVDGESVLNLNNRYSSLKNPSLADKDADVEMYEELVWSGDAATEAILKDDASKKLVKNVTDGDDRHDLPLALAVQGKKMTIAIDNSVEDDDYEGKVAGLYVTLDYKANAIESAPSEWNAWNSYKYTGLNTVVEGTSTTITIDSEETINDIIGFRVYAVNHDGTLLDPDGRAFYVLVGEQAAEAQTIAATMKPVNDIDDKFISQKEVTVDLTAAQSEVITSILTNKNYDSSKDEFEMADNKPVAVDKAGNPYPVAYAVSYNWKDNKVVSATFTLVGETTIASLINDQTYKASIVYKNTNGHVLGTVNFELTKTMPTTFPTDFAFLPKQETEEGSGKFTAYMIPVNGYAVTTASGYGYKDLNNVFYGLDDYYKFVFGTSAADTDKDGVLNNVTVVDTNEAVKKGTYNLTVSENETEGYFIDEKTSHAVSVWYTYPGISTKKHAEEDYYLVGEDHEVAYNKTLEATYACWEDASKFAWGTYKSEDGKSVLSHKPALQWTAEAVGEKANLSDIESTNSYNNDYFGLDLESLVNTNKWLSIVPEEVKLTAGEQVNPYFKPEVKGSEIIFNQIKQQVDAAPVADHEETLVIVVKDAFGHKSTITLPVTVKAPEKK